LLQAERKQMGDGNKLVAIALFIATIIKKIKCNNNKFATITHFHFKQFFLKNGQ